MTLVSRNTEQKYLLDGKQYNAPIDWEDIIIDADYEDDTVQPSLTVENFTFVLEARDAILQWVEDGKNGGPGIFEGMPFQLTLFNNLPVQENFKAFIDFTNGFRDLVEDCRADVSIIKDDGLDNFFSQISILTYGRLETLGLVTQADYTDIEYVVEKKFNLLEILTISMMLYLMLKELAESIEKTADAAAQVIAIAASGFTGPVGAALLTAAKVIIAAAYSVFMIVIVIDLGVTLINTLVPPQRTHKAILLRRALEIVAAKFGLTLVAPAVEFDYTYYLPSNPRLDDKTLLGFIDKLRGTPTGIPNVQDYGYNCEEMFELARNQIKGKYAIIGDELHLRPKNDSFWIQTATWKFPSKLIEIVEYNTGELQAQRLLSFQVDPNNEWTIDNYKGTSYEIRTDNNVVNNERAVLLKGLEELNFRVGLPTRKSELNGMENLLLKVAKAVDSITGLFGGGTNFASDIITKIGNIKQSQNWHSIPYLVYLDGGSLPTNHRELYSAKVLYDKYHKESSFVLDNFTGQKKLYNNLSIPFGFEDYKILTQNSYFNYNGKEAKITKFSWTVGKDRADVSFWVREPYTFNLNESYIESE